MTDDYDRTELDAENPPSGLGTGLCGSCKAPIDRTADLCVDCIDDADQAYAG